MARDWGRESTQGSAASEVGDVFGGRAVYNYCPARLSPFRGTPVARDAPVARDPKDTGFGRSGGGPTVPPSDPNFCVCGPDFTDQIAAVWRRIQAEFGKWPDAVAAAFQKNQLVKMHVEGF